MPSLVTQLSISSITLILVSWFTYSMIVRSMEVVSRSQGKVTSLGELDAQGKVDVFKTVPPVRL